MRIQSVTIRRFKRIQEVTFPITDVTLLVGANNAGKSSALQALHFAVALAQTSRLIGEGVAWRRDSFELSFNPAQLLYTPVADVMSLASGGMLQEAKASRIEIQIATEDGQRCVVGLRRGRNRNISVELEGRSLGEQLMSLEAPFSVYAPGLAGVPRSENFISPGVVRRVVARGDANLVLRNVLHMLSSDPAKWSTFGDDMRSIFPEIQVAVDFAENTDEHIEVYFQLPGGPRLPMDAAGTSILQTSQIFAYIGLFSPQVLILDEPDSHLHPNNQRLLCEVVYRLATERNFKALVSTHSRHVLDALRDRASLIWMSKGRLVAEDDRSTTAILLDLGALDSADYFATDTLRCVVATEDTDTKPLESLLWSNGFSEEDTEIATYVGCSNVQAALVLGTFLGEKAPNLTLVVHRDADYMSPEAATKFKNRLSGRDVSPFVTDFSDIEGYFINAEHLSYVNPGLTVERATILIDEATVAAADDSIRALVNQRTREAFAARREEGQNVDHGEISLAAHRDYHAMPASMRRGKEVLGRLAALIQADIGENPRIVAASPYLVVPALRAIASEIWPAE